MRDLNARWHIKSHKINKVVVARNQDEAWEALRELPATDFGLIVTAEAGENANPIAIHTAALMFRWHRDADARLFIEVALASGLPDTTQADLRTAGRL